MSIGKKDFFSRFYYLARFYDWKLVKTYAHERFRNEKME